MPISQTYMQIAQHLQERREHPRTEARTAQNTHQMAETINLSNIYKMQMWIRNDGAIPEHPFPCRLTGLMLITCLLTHFPPPWTLAGLWVYHLSLLTASAACWTAFLLATYFNYLFTRCPVCFPFCLPLSVFTSLLLASRLCDYLMFSCQASTYIKGYSMIGC